MAHQYGGYGRASGNSGGSTEMKLSSPFGQSCQSKKSKKRKKSEKPAIDDSDMGNYCTGLAGSAHCGEFSEAVLSVGLSDDHGSSTGLTDPNMWQLSPQGLVASSCSKTQSMQLGSASLPFADEPSLPVADANEHSRGAVSGQLPSSQSSNGYCEQEVNQCPYCKLKFKHKCHLSRHLKQHKETTRYSCSICGREFNRKDCLNKHLRIHAGIRPYPCDVCGKTFPEMTALKRHITVHSDQKPYQCDVCGMSYSQADYLKRHLLTHGGQTQPYACDHCGLRFTLRSRLRTHALTHTGVKPYPCDICGQRYSRAEYVKQHKRVLHAEQSGTIQPTQAGQG